MGLFKKKEKVPIIPTTPSLPPLPPIKEGAAKKELPGLPSFPTSSKNENLNQEMVKSAVADMPNSEGKKKEIEVPESFQINETPKEESMTPSSLPVESLIPELPKRIISLPPKAEIQKPKTLIVNEKLAPTLEEASKQNEPIFVRIDKFQAAQKNFEDIRSKVAEMESVLQKIKEVKAQEEDELKGWGEDTENLKSRLAEIDGDIFSQL